MRRRLTALAVAALVGVTAAARRPGASWSATAIEDDDAGLRAACEDLSPDLARHVLDRTPLSYRVASASKIADRVIIWGQDGIAGHFGGHGGGAIRGLEVSPCGEWALTWGGDGSAVVWDMASYRATKTLQHGGVVDFARIFPGGGRVLTCGTQGECVVWEVGSWRQVCKIGTKSRHALQRLTLAELHGNDAMASLRAAEVLPHDDGVVILGGGLLPAIWDVPRGEERCLLRGISVSVARPFPDGSRLLTATYLDRRPMVWNASSCALLLQLAHPHIVLDIAVLGEALTTVDINGIIFIWGKDSGLLQRRLAEPMAFDPPYSLLPFPDGQRLAMVYRSQLLIWNVTSGVALHNISHAAIESVAIAPCGDVIATCSDVRAAAWDTQTGAQVLVPVRMQNYQGDVVRSCFVAVSWGTVLGHGVRGPPWRSLLSP